MELKDLCASLEPSKRLCELGVKQESLFWWNPYDYEDQLENFRVDYRLHTEPVNCVKHPTWSKDYVPVSAFTSSELGEMLPDDVFPAFYRTLGGNWGVHLDRVEQTALYADTEADARAKTLIHLIEQKLIEVPNA